MFLDIACALLWRSKDMAICIWESVGWSTALDVWTLVEKALVIVDDNGSFNMHDHLRDLRCGIERKGRTSLVATRNL